VCILEMLSTLLVLAMEIGTNTATVKINSAIAKRKTNLRIDYTQDHTIIKMISNAFSTPQDVLERTYDVCFPLSAIIYAERVPEIIH